MMARVLLLCFTSASALIAPRSTIARGRLVARAPRARAPQMAVAQYAGQAASLFNNMKTPASILAGALLPIGILTALPPPREGAEKEHAWLGALRELHLVIASASFCSELLSVMWATIAVNKLTETAVAPAESVFALLMRDCELPWVACNAVSCPALPVVLSLCEPPPPSHPRRAALRVRHVWLHVSHRDPSFPCGGERAVRARRGGVGGLRPGAHGLDREPRRRGRRR